MRPRTAVALTYADAWYRRAAEQVRMRSGAVGIDLAQRAELRLLIRCCERRSVLEHCVVQEQPAVADALVQLR